jgi:hypothetical protein
MNTEYVYLLQEREFIKTHENIYKVGKTTQPNLKRITNYSNGTKLITQIICTCCDNVEKELITLFKTKFKLCKDIGNEYFEGDCMEMMKIMFDTVFKKNDESPNVKSLNYSSGCLEIHTMNDFIKISTIKKVVITNKLKAEGYIKLKGTGDKWLIIHKKGSNEEDLMGFLKNCHEEMCYCDNNNNILNQNEFETLNYIATKLRIECNYENIHKDIIKNYYCPNPKRPDVGINEYIIQYYDNLKQDKKFLIFKSDDFTFRDITDKENDFIIDHMNCPGILRYSPCIINNSNTINTSIVTK